MKEFLLQFFTWWNGQTLGTRLHTWRFGVRVGEDEFGNVYYKDRRGIDPTVGFERRWVIYNGDAEASRIPPGWWAWMHKKVDEPPSEVAYKAPTWVKPHEPNLTGTARAYRPPGSTLRGGQRPAVTGDYDAWTPGD